MGYCLCNLFGPSSSHVGTKIWFWYPTESRCTTHNCNALSFARHALATKTFTPKLEEVLKIVVEYVNYVRNNAMKHRIIKELCNEMSSEFEVLLYYSYVWWLSPGKMLNRVFTLRMELAVFLREHQHHHAHCFENSEFILVLACMVDIFDALNNFNQQVQGGGVNIIETEVHLKGLKKND